MRTLKQIAIDALAAAEVALEIGLDDCNDDPDCVYADALAEVQSALEELKKQTT